MKDIINNRLQTLKQEYATGIKLQAEYEAKLKDLRETLLRISGAIQVLEEISDETASEKNGQTTPSNDSPAVGETAVERAAV